RAAAPRARRPRAAEHGHDPRGRCGHLRVYTYLTPALVTLRAQLRLVRDGRVLLNTAMTLAGAAATYVSTPTSRPRSRASSDWTACC
ncbi:hypothetical protein, partial [Eggerthella sinensis]|uniref:hypothetical protein n=1 Tax=Eggerthella sinensis TaxID=242230 RepID=UPI0022E4ADA1